MKLSGRRYSVMKIKESFVFLFITPEKALLVIHTEREIEEWMHSYIDGEMVGGVAGLMMVLDKHDMRCG